MRATREQWVLSTAAIGVGGLGLVYLADPGAILGLYGIRLQSVSEANLFRSACGGVFLAFTALFVAGARALRWRWPALLAMTV